MSIPENIFEHTSETLSAVIGSVLDDEELAQPATLASVREAILSEVKTVTVPLNRFSPEEGQQLRDEIDALIEEYGEDALAVRFMRPGASELLGRLIEAALDEFGVANLGGVFQAAETGLIARLIAQGEIDDDEAQTLLSELKALIEQYGEEALAEDLLRNG